MLYDYIVTLKNPGGRYIDRFSLLLLIASVILFVREQYLSPNIRISYLFGSIAVAVIVAWNLYQQQKNRTVVFYNSALFIAAIAWVTMPFLSWLFIPFSLLALFERLAKKPLEIGFSSTEVAINTLFKKKYSWSQFNNIVLKDDLLTLDFRNNRLFQRETIDDDSDAGEDEFNAFCREQLRNSSLQP